MNNCENTRRGVESGHKKHCAGINTLMKQGRELCKIMAMTAAALSVSMAHPGIKYDEKIYPSEAPKQADTVKNPKDTSGKGTKLPGGCFWGGSSGDGKGAAIYCYAKAEQAEKEEDGKRDGI